MQKVPHWFPFEVCLLNFLFIKILIKIGNLADKLLSLAYNSLCSNVLNCMQTAVVCSYYYEPSFFSSRIDIMAARSWVTKCTYLPWTFQDLALLVMVESRKMHLFYTCLWNDLLFPLQTMQAVSKVFWFTYGSFRCLATLQSAAAIHKSHERLPVSNSPNLTMWGSKCDASHCIFHSRRNLPSKMSWWQAIFKRRFSLIVAS